jgi:gamma-glutamyl phosphate reductase
VRYGVPAVIIASGKDHDSMQRVVAGEQVGTLFVEDPDTLLAAERAGDTTGAVKRQAEAARAGGRALLALTSAERAAVLRAVAAGLDEHRERVMRANDEDLEKARVQSLAAPLMRRLQLTSAKIDTLIEGIRAIADDEEPIGKVSSRRELSDGVVLTKETVPIGVLLVIFESRPDSLPQIAALALRSGNGLLLKGGREAENSNKCLHGIIVDAVVAATQRRVPAGVIGLVTTRADIGKLLALEKDIDLVIPRGSNAMVRQIQGATNIPVLGHADGVCHVYLHPTADMALAARVLVDAKMNYPAACNAMETLLVDSRVPAADAQRVLAALKEAGVALLGSARAIHAGWATDAVDDWHAEYGDHRLAVDIVDGVDAAVAHINTHGSHHTDAILALDAHDDAVAFVRGVDSACVFQNASTRMADGYRMGLGAEVGISTSRIHARGPVGVQGLLSDKWVLRGTGGAVATAEAYASGTSKFTHTSLPM